MLFVVKRVEALVNKAGIYIFLLLISCSSDDDPANPNIPNNPNPPGGPVVGAPPGSQTCVLTTVHFTTLSYIITRNDTGLPTKLTFTKYMGKDIDHSCTFEYDDSRRLIKLENKTLVFTYKYDGLSRVISEKLEPKPSPQVPHIKELEKVFTYNEQDYLDSAYTSKEDYQRYVYDDKGNVIKRFVKYPGQPEFLAQEYLEFDDKKNPFYEFSFSYNILLDLSGVIATVTSLNPVRHKTNIVQSKFYESNGTFTASSVTLNYNDSGYPVSSGSSTVYGYQCK